MFLFQAADQALQTVDGTVFPKWKNLAHLAEEYVKNAVVFTLPFNTSE